MKILTICFLLLTAAQAGLRAAQEPSRYRFEYKVSVELPVAGSPVRLWLPFPREDGYQKINSHDVKSDLPAKLMKEKKYGNRILYFEGTPEGKTLDVTVTYDVTRKPATGIAAARAKAGSLDDPARYLKEERTSPFAPVFKQIVSEEIKPAQTEDQKIRALYDYTFRTMKYDKSGEGWGRGDPIWACENKRGNCTDFHSLFIALNRTIGIPARFFMGVAIPAKEEGEIAGYHCWAQAYSHAAGWIPVDASEARKADDAERYYGELPADRIEFSLGRDITLEPKQAGEPLNYFIYPYAEVDGKPLTDGVKKQFSFKRLDATKGA